jgi:hypothetical protein
MQKAILLVLISIIIYSNQKQLPPETFLGFEDYVKFFNYPMEKHSIQTEDGYILTFFRI